MVATHIKKIKHSKLCVIGVHTIFVILHLNVSCWRVSSSYLDSCPLWLKWRMVATYNLFD